MKSFHRLSAALICLAVWLLVWPAFAVGTTVTFLLVNDIYEMGDRIGLDGKRRGGFARLAAIVKAERASGRHVIFAHGGDTLSPSLMSALDRGAHIIELTNMIPPDVFAPGNHEFDFGKAVFLERMSEARFPVYAANLRGPDGAPLPNFRDRSVVTVDGVRIGLTGATYDGSPRVSNPGDLRFLPTVPAMTAQAEALRGEGIDFVVAVMHATRRQSLDLMATGKVDLILTGHTHDLFVNFDGRSAVVESSYDAHYVVAVDVTIDVRERDGRRSTTWWPQFRIIDTAEVKPDPDVAAVVARYEAGLAKQLDVPIATTAVELDSRRVTVRTGEAVIGDIIADAMRAAVKADAAVMNAGGIRADKLYPPGSTLTRRDVLSELPFGNRIVLVEMTGRELRQTLEFGLAQLPRGSGRFPQVSGIVITADPLRPAGARIVTIEVAGQPLDHDRMYRVAINDFMARGGDGYADFAAAKPITAAGDGPLLAGEVMAYLHRLGNVTTGVEGRIRLR